MKKELDLKLALQECLEGPSADAIRGAGEGSLLAALGYLAALAAGYDCASPTQEDAESFLRLLKEWDTE